MGSNTGKSPALEAWANADDEVEITPEALAEYGRANAEAQDEYEQEKAEALAEYSRANAEAYAERDALMKLGRALIERGTPKALAAADEIAAELAGN